MNTAALWMGPFHPEARSAYARAREAGLTPVRALVVGTIASFKDCWAFRSKLAGHVGCSIRTVQRAITQAKAEGLIGVARAKLTEKPPHCDFHVPCGWSHRWTVGWGKAGEVVQKAVAVAKAKWIATFAKDMGASRTRVPRARFAASERQQKAAYPVTGRKLTAAELDAELERIPRQHDPPPE